MRLVASCPWGSSSLALWMGNTPERSCLLASDLYTSNMIFSRCVENDAYQEFYVGAVRRALGNQGVYVSLSVLFFLRSYVRKVALEVHVLAKRPNARRPVFSREERGAIRGGGARRVLRAVDPSAYGSEGV